MRRTASCLVIALLYAHAARGQTSYPSQPSTYPGTASTPSGVQIYSTTSPSAPAQNPYQNHALAYPQQPAQSNPGQVFGQPSAANAGTPQLSPIPGMPSLGPTRVQQNGAPSLPQYSGSTTLVQTPAQAATQGPAPVAENRVTFDPRQADLQWMNNHWVLMAGKVFLKDFGTRETDGREALRVIQTLNLTDLGRVGTPRPVMEYWLANGQAPQPVNLGSHVLSLDPGTLRVEESLGQWQLRNNWRTFFAFHDEAEAKQALAIIRRYNFTHVGYVGQGAPSMLVFLSNPSESQRDPRLVAPTPMTPRTTMPGVNHLQGISQFQGGTITPVQYNQPNAGQTTPGSANLVQPVDLRHAPITVPYDPAQMGGGATPQQMTGRPVNGFAPTPPPVKNASDRMAFDFRQVQARQDGKEWKLMYGSRPLASFGNNQHDAQLAQALIQHYHFTEQVSVGHNPAFSYFLVGSQAPRGLMMGMDGAHFEAASLALQHLPGGWALCGPSGVLAQFGEDSGEANRALEAINRQKCDLLCHVGHEGPGLTFLVRTR